MKICSVANLGKCGVPMCKHSTPHEEMDECIGTWCSRKNDLLRCVYVRRPLKAAESRKTTTNKRSTQASKQAGARAQSVV